MQNKCRRYRILVAPCQADPPADGFEHCGGPTGLLSDPTLNFVQLRFRSRYRWWE